LKNLLLTRVRGKSRKIVMENFGEMDGADGMLKHQGVWKNKRKLFPKIKTNFPSIESGISEAAGGIAQAEIDEC
jgi:hypothetical protein